MQLYQKILRNSLIKKYNLHIHRCLSCGQLRPRAITCGRFGTSSLMSVSRTVTARPSASLHSHWRFGLVTSARQKHEDGRTHTAHSSPSYLSTFFGSSHVTDWSKAVSEAEKLVGYPTSFMSLRYLLSDEFSTVAMHMRKLVGTKHPLVKTARNFVYDGTNSFQMRGLLVLLVAKAAGPAKEPRPDMLETMVSGIYPSQRNLAEITEMIHTANLIHKGVVNLADLQDVEGLLQDMHFGNKMAVLSGDFLLANASTALARLYSTEVVELISSAIRDLMAAEFTKCSTEGKEGDLSQGHASICDWEKNTFLSTGSLLAKSCKAVLMLANHNEKAQEHVYQFGVNMGYAYQLHQDMTTLSRTESTREETLRAVTVPVALHLAHRPEDEQLIGKLSSSSRSTELVDHLTKSGCVDEARGLCRRYQTRALTAIGALGSSDAQLALTNIVRAVTDT